MVGNNDGARRFLRPGRGEWSRGIGSGEQQKVQGVGCRERGSRSGKRLRQDGGAVHGDAEISAAEIFFVRQREIKGVERSVAGIFQSEGGADFKIRRRAGDETDFEKFLFRVEAWAERDGACGGQQREKREGERARNRRGGQRGNCSGESDEWRIKEGVGFWV